MIDSLRHAYRLGRLLARFGLAKSTYEYHRARKDDVCKYEAAKVAILTIYEQSRQTYGYRRIRLMLRRNEGVALSGKTVRKLMNELGVHPAQRRKGRYNSYRKQTSQPEPNILQRNFKSTEVCEKLVSDVTEFQVAGQKVYLSPLIDLFNGEVVGRSVSMSPTVEFVDGMFAGVAEKIPSWIHPTAHTDQGLQYWHKDYKQHLSKIGAMQSMSRKANCQDNAPAESFFGHLKSEFFYRESFKTVEEFKKELDTYIDWYDNDRIRCDLGGMSPVEFRKFHEAMG